MGAGLAQYARTVTGRGGAAGGGNPRENREVIRAPKVRQKYPRQILYRDAVPNRDAVILIATRHATSLQMLRCLHDHAGITTGNGGLDRMRGEGRDGRGNLRENREDSPAPTVGRLRGFHCDPHRAQRPPIAAAMRVPGHPASPP